MFPFNFAPYEWAQCDGQLLPIRQYTALFSLLGVAFGGNGTSTFGLPNLQGQAAMDAGNGVGLTPRTVGEIGGSPNVTLLQNELPLHTHLLQGDTTVGTSKSPSANLLGVAAINPRNPHEVYVPGAATTQMITNNMGPIGGNQPHNNIQPYLVLNFCIALTGIFPSRG